MAIALLLCCGRLSADRTLERGGRSIAGSHPTGPPHRAGAAPRRGRADRPSAMHRPRRSSRGRRPRREKSTDRLTPTAPAPDPIADPASLQRRPPHRGRIAEPGHGSVGRPRADADDGTRAVREDLGEGRPEGPRGRRPRAGVQRAIVRRLPQPRRVRRRRRGRPEYRDRDRDGRPRRGAGLLLRVQHGLRGGAVRVPDGQRPRAASRPAATARPEARWPRSIRASGSRGAWCCTATGPTRPTTPGASRCPASTGRSWSGPPSGTRRLCSGRA